MTKNNKYKPKVSIIIPVYNGSTFMQEAIDSALGQIYENIEVLVINDGSDDLGKTDAIAKSYGDQIRYFVKENGGVATALNLGVRVMSGDYFSWLSHDDVYFPEKIETQISHLKKIGRDVAIYSDYQFIDESSNYLGHKKVPDIPPSKFATEIVCRAELVHGCSLLIPRHFFCATGFFDERLLTVQDYDLWIRMAEDFDFVHLPKVLISSRVHSGQGVRTRRELWQRECNEFYLEHLRRIFSKSTDYEVMDSLAEFSLKAAIKMERFGLSVPASMCREVFCRTWCIELIKFKLSFFYWLGYYALFRIKRFWSF